MFGKILARELKQYIRRLWPFLLGYIVMSVLTCLVVIFDSNPIEATGTVTAIGFFIIAAVVFVISGLVHAYKAFYDSIKSINTEEQPPLKSFLWARIVAFYIYVVVALLLLLAGVSSFAWQYVWQMFLAIVAEWYYLPEFLLYMVIIPPTMYIIPIACIVALRNGKHKKRSLAVGIIAYMMGMFTVVLEVVLLIHSPDTDMSFVWGMLALCFALYIPVAIRMFLTTYRTLKLEVFNK